MQVTINTEVTDKLGPHKAAIVMGALSMVEGFSNIEVREQQTSYAGPEGEVTTTVVVARFNWTFGRLIPPFTRLAYVFGQDCLAARWFDTAGGLWQELYGPKREDWLPFNPDYFVEF